jgi:hypothetical protein
MSEYMEESESFVSQWLKDEGCMCDGEDECDGQCYPAQIEAEWRSLRGELERVRAENGDLRTLVDLLRAANRTLSEPPAAVVTVSTKAGQLGQ